MKTLQEEWLIYRNSVYPTGISGIQNKECHQAFFAGALVALKAAVQDASALPPEEAVKQLAAIVDEAKGVCSLIVRVGKSRN